jgi:hypothetical protein
MYKIYIEGYGAEITQGALPIDIVNQIRSEVEEDSDLAEYFIEAQMSDDKLNWFDVDDNFHSYGAFTNDSTLYVEDEQGNIIFKEACFKLKCTTEHTKELYPEDFELESIGVLTCIDKLKGCFYTGTISEKFNSSKLCLHAEALGDHVLITSITYDNKELQDTDLGETISKNFFAYLED